MVLAHKIAYRTISHKNNLMKKYILCLAAATLTLGFTACDDVPAPYEVNKNPGTGGDQGGNENTGAEKTIFSANFDTDAEGFEFKNVTLSGSLTYVWKQDSYNGKGYLKASAFASSKSNASEAWAVSPAINLKDSKKASLTFRHAINKIAPGVPSEMCTVWASTDYIGDVKTATWTQINVPNYPEGTSWTFIDAGTMDISAFCGKEKVYIAFKYASTDEASGTWEVDEFCVKGDGTAMENGGTTTPDKPETPGTPDKPDTPDTPVTPPTGDNLLLNGGFETWADGVCEGWKSTTSASSAKLTQSTDAHSGSYSVCVACDEKSNKRLGSKEYTLKAGTYTLSMYVKGEGQVKLGYAVVGEDGKIAGGDSYNYSGYITTDANWKLVTYEFTLDKETTVNFVVMNPKTSSYAKASDKLIDDFSLVTSNGGIAAAIHRVK